MPFAQICGAFPSGSAIFLIVSRYVSFKCSSFGCVLLVLPSLLSQIFT